VDEGVGEDLRHHEYEPLRERHDYGQPTVVVKDEQDKHDGYDYD